MGNCIQNQSPDKYNALISKGTVVPKMLSSKTCANVVQLEFVLQTPKLCVSAHPKALHTLPSSGQQTTHADASLVSNINPDHFA
jgi:hypothetical protein